jgi:hypothetical protein
MLESKVFIHLGNCNTGRHSIQCSEGGRRRADFKKMKTATMHVALLKLLLMNRSKDYQLSLFSRCGGIKSEGGYGILWFLWCSPSSSMLPAPFSVC